MAKPLEMHCLCNKEEVKWIEDYVDRGTAVARKWVQDTPTTIMEEVEDIRHAEQELSTPRKHEKSCDEILLFVRDIVSTLASSDDEECREDKDDD